MKRLQIIVILLLIVLAACNSKRQVPESVEGPSKELSAIDSLMWQQPDSALACLLSYFDTCCRDAMIASPETPRGDSIETHAMRLYNRHYAHLLLAELLYKNYQPQTNRPELLEAVAYFDSLLAADTRGGTDTRGVSLQGSRRRDARRASAQNTAFLDARAHYINGVGYYEQDSVAPACKEYLKALEVMEDRFEEKELVGEKAKFMTLTYNRLVELFSAQYMQELAIYCGKQALVYNRIAPTSPYGNSSILYKIGKQYDKLRITDSAAYYYDRALELMPPGRNTMIYRDIVSSIALSNFYALQDTVSSMDSLKSMAAQAENETERLNRYRTIGGVYYDFEQYDSAKVYLEPVMKKNARREIIAARLLREIALIEGNTLKANQYAQYLVEETSSSATNQAQISKLNDVFQKYLQDKKEAVSLREQRKAIRLTLMVLVPLLVAIGLTVAIVMRRRHRKRMATQQAEAQQRLEEERQSHRMEQAALSGRLKRSNQEVRELQDQIRQMDDLAAKNEPVTSFNEEPICRLIMERVHDGRFKSKIDCGIYKSYALDKQQLLDLRMAADRHFCQFTLRLRKAYPKLTNIDIDYCCLYLLNLTHADVSALMQRAYNTVVERDSKIQKTIGSEDPLHVSLMDIAHNPSSI